MKRPAVPAGYAIERERGAIVVALPSIIEEVRAAIRSADTLYAAAAAQPDARAFTGRGQAWLMHTADGACVVRHYRRGGAVARLLDDEYARVGVPRPLRELRASAAARARGVATPEVMACVIYRAGPAAYRGDIATRYLARTSSLADIAISAERADPPARVAAWHAAGAMLRRAFDAGVHHADLNLRNILIRSDGSAAEAFLLDLDRAVVRRHAVNAEARNAMLARLHRSRRKLEALAGYVTPADELAAFDAALRRD